VLHWLTILVPAVCAGLYETVRHSLLATELPNAVGTLIAVALVLAISSAFARVAFGLIRQTNARLRERNRDLQALSREVQRLAVIEERDRIAREMHDGVAQVVAYLMVRLDTIHRLLDRGRLPEASREIENLRASADGAYADVREAIAGLRTRPGVGAAGLAEALATYIAEFGERTHIDASFHPHVPPFASPMSATTGGVAPAAAAGAAGAAEAVFGELSPAAELQLLRIAQESLANVRKHANAPNVDVWFWGDAEGWHLAVRDDGRGFDPHRPTDPGKQHFGLPIMRERAQGLGGSLTIITAPGAGTTVQASVPHHPHRSPSAPAPNDPETDESPAMRIAG